MIIVRPTGFLDFSVVAPCGQGWVGMRHSDDVRFVIDRALDHVKLCAQCAESDEIRGDVIERGR
jgi:hypothetical protein